jgi:hypothetical protein
MAKKGSRQGTTRQRNVSAKTMVDFAEDLGRMLGTAQAKASNWLNQRKNVIEELTQLRDTANQLLGDLTGSGAAATRGGRRGPRPAANGTAAQPAASAGARKGGRRKMSAAARREVSQRMRRYWAARRKEKAAQG